MACCLLPVCCGASFGREESVVQRAADQILRHQMQDGAIVLGTRPEQGARVMPYFGDLAAIGLVSAYRSTHRTAYREAVRRWVGWYEDHLNADGTIFDYTGAIGAWHPTGDYDSTDSYAATYLELVWTEHQADRDDAWLRGRAASIHKVLASIRRTLQPNGLSISKPTYPVMYVMDNVETLRGLRAAASIAQTLDDKQQAAEMTRLASRMQSAIDRDLWNPAQQCYRIGIQTDGGKMEGLKQWYPDVMANLMAVAWLPASARNRALFARLKDRFGGELPQAVRSEDDLERLVWWGLAARGAGDTAFAEQIRKRLDGFDAVASEWSNPALLGHLCRIENGRE